MKKVDPQDVQSKLCEYDKYLSAWKKENNPQKDIGYMQFNFDEKRNELLLRIDQCSEPEIRFSDQILKCVEQVDCVIIQETDLSNPKAFQIWLELMQHLVKVKSLSLRSVSFPADQFPAENELGKGLRKVTRVKISQMQFFTVPDALIKGDEKIIELDVSSSRIRELPAEIIPSLVSLNVALSSVAQLPEISKKLKNLKTLNIRNTSITEIPDNYFCDALETLIIGDRTNVEWPQQVNSLENLKYLSIAGTNIKHLPNDPLFCKVLERLDISDTEIEELPEWLMNSKQIKSLDLSGLTIERLSREMVEHCIRQRILFKDEKSIADMDTSSDPIEDGVFLSKTIIRAMDIRYILTNDTDFLSEYFEKEERIANHSLPVIFCGDTEKNNRQFILNLISEGDDTVFRDVVGLEKTEPMNLIDAFDRRYLHGNARITFSRLKAEPPYQDCHQLFVGNSGIFVVLIDLTAQESPSEKALRWARYIELYSPHAHILYVLRGMTTHQELSMFEFFPTMNALHIPVHYFGTMSSNSDVLNADAPENELHELRKRLAALILEASGYTAEMPAAWIAMREHVSDVLATTGVISIDQYKSICNRWGIVNEKTMIKLIDWFEEQGICNKQLSQDQGKGNQPIALLSSMRTAIAAYRAVRLAVETEGIVRPHTLLEKLEDYSDVSVAAYREKDVQIVLSFLMRKGLCIQRNDTRGNQYFAFPLYCNLPRNKHSNLTSWMKREPLENLYATHYMVRFAYLARPLFAAVLQATFDSWSECWEDASKEGLIESRLYDEKFYDYAFSGIGAYFAFPLCKEYGGGTLFLGMAAGVDGCIHIYASEQQVPHSSDEKINVRLAQHLKRYASFVLKAVDDVCKTNPQEPYTDYKASVYYRQGLQTVQIDLQELLDHQKAGHSELFVPIMGRNENCSEMVRRYLPDYLQ